MALTPYIPSYWSNLGPGAAVSANPAFQDYPTTPGLPTSWAQVAGATPTRVNTGQVGPLAMRLLGGAAADAYVKMQTPFFTFPGLGWYVIDVVVTLVSGALTGAGLRFIGIQNDNTTVSLIDAYNFPFVSTPDVNGAVIGVGTVGNTYRWKIFQQVKDPLSVNACIFAMSHWSTLGSTAGANSIDWSQCSFRAAMPGEIAGNNQVQGLAVMPLLPGIAPDRPKQPTWSSIVKYSASGRRKGTGLWSAPKWGFELGLDVIRDRPTNGELDGLWEFFNTIQGRGATWLFLDAADYQVNGDQFGTGDGATTVFQIGRKIRNFLEPIYAPFGASIYKAGVLQTGGGTNYTLGNNGVVTFTAAPANGAALTWYGGFFFICEMSDDRLDTAKMMEQLWKGALKFISVKP